jgi:hypothetical protein
MRAEHLMMPPPETRQPCARGAPRSRPPLPEESPSPSLAPLEGNRRKSRGGRLSDAERPGQSLGPGTLAVRWCSDCGRFLGVKLWPRTGHSLVHTHGLCRKCYRRMMRRLMMDALEGPVSLRAEPVGNASDLSPL